MLAAIRSALPEGAILDTAGERWSYGLDNSREQAMPDLVVLPTRHDEVAAVVSICVQYGVPVIARGRGTNTTGATVPIRGGVVISLERMNRILRIEPGNRLAVVEPGVLNGDLQAALAAHGFFWPPDPTSSPFCSIGGNLACNAAGPRAVKYGTPRENTLGLRAVIGTGESLRCGVYTTKGVVGYDLTRLLIGSEGSLGLITEATLKLTPRPEAIRTLRALYRDVDAAARAVSALMAQPLVPCALEFMDATALRLAREGGAEIPPADALLMIEIDGGSQEVGALAAQLAGIARNDGCVSVEIAHDAAEVAMLWSARKALSPRLRSLAPNKINEDVVVPVARIPELVRGLGEISTRFGIPIVNFGHAGNGNLHVNLLYRPEFPAQKAAAPDCLAAVFDLVLALDGTLSGEHGIGLVKREHVARELDPLQLRLMRGIKAQFDPHGILNPGKLLPDDGHAEPGPA